jgi:hypothetical protein
MVHEGTQLSGLQKVPKVPKRDLVDTCYHASHVTRYGATLGLGFPTLCERGVACWGNSRLHFHSFLGKGAAYILGLLFLHFPGQGEWWVGLHLWGACFPFLFMPLSLFWRGKREGLLILGLLSSLSGKGGERDFRAGVFRAGSFEGKS